MEKKKLITALMVCCMAVLPACANQIINTVERDIIGETFTGNTNEIGGAIYNDGTGATLNINNTAFENNTSTNQTYGGGAIYNNAGTVNIEDNVSFTNNYINNEYNPDGSGSNSYTSAGGAISSWGSGTVNITGENVRFEGNGLNSETGNPSWTYGGALYIDTAGDKQAVLNIGEGTVFENNQSAVGGAIYMGGTDAEITGAQFTGNKTDYGSGGTIYVYGGPVAGATETTKSDITITDTTFEDNYSGYSGGAISNRIYGSYDDSKITITGSTFEGNYANAQDDYAGGGAIENRGTIVVSGSEFNDNSAAKEGGAIINWGATEITGSTFDGNEAESGGAIYNYTQNLTIQDTTFTNNTATKNGGALYNASGAVAALTDVTVNEGTGAGQNSIYNAGTINTAVDDGVNTFNSDIISENGTLNLGGTNNVGGDISGTGTVANNGTSVFAGDNSDFTGTFTQDSPGAETTVTGTFFGGTSTIEGGILNWETDKAISEDGSLSIAGGELNIGNSTNTGNLTVGTNVTIADAVETTINDGSTLTVNGGSITMGSDDTWNKDGSIALTAGDLTLTDITATGILNATGGTLTMNNVQLGENFSIDADVIVKSDSGFEIVENTHFAYDNNDEIGGALQLVGGTLDYGADENHSIELSATSGNLNLLENSYLKVTNQSLINDNVIVDIRNGSTLEVLNGEFNLNGVTGSPEQSDQWNGLIVNNGGTVNADNISNSATGALKQENGITNITNNSSVNLGTTSSVTGGTINVTGNSILNAVDSAIIKGGEINVTSGSTFSTGGGVGFDGANDLVLNASGLVDSMNGSLETHNGNTLNIGDAAGNNQADFTLDVYGRSNSNKGSDSFVFNTIADATGNGATINISDFSLGGDIYGWDAPIDRHIELGNLFESANLNGNVELNVTDKEVHTPIGYYKLNNIGGLGGAYSLDLARFDGPVFRGQVATVAQWMNQLAIDDMLFTHSMVLPSFKEEDGGTASSGVMANRYAATSPMFAPYQYSRKDGGLWYKMYGNFESLQMNNGLRVGNNSYGALIGADFGLKELKHGWKFMPTAYIGYNGAHQTFANMGAYQNGGQAGFLGTWYKNNFIIGGLIYGGVYDNSMDVAGHTENTFNYFAGAATKAAYNIRLHRDWVLQPNIMAAYNFFGQQNWHSDYGQMGMMAGMLHGVNIAPGVNLIWEKETFSAYITLQYMYNINGAVGGRAGNVSLPLMEMERGYIQYGIGFTKKFTDRASGYLQAVLRNVGRTGAGFQLGFNYFIGK